MKRTTTQRLYRPRLKEISARPTLGNFFLGKLDQSAIQISVAARWIAPRHVCRHAVALNPSPGSHVVKRGASPLQDAGKIFRGDRSKFEPGLSAAGDRQISCVEYRILQPAATGPHRNHALHQS